MPGRSCTRAEGAGREVWRDIARKKYLRATDFVSGAAGHLLKRHASALDSRARQLGRKAVRSHLDHGLFRSASAAAEEVAEHAGMVRRISRTLPGVGAVADAAIDIHDGTPPAGAISQAAAGLVVGTVADATTGLVSSVATPWVGVPAGLLTGTVAGEAASLGAGKLYDFEQNVAEKVVPDGVKAHIPKFVKSGCHKFFG